MPSLAVVEGTLVLARAHRDPAVLHVALEGLLAAVSQLAPPRNRPKTR